MVNKTQREENYFDYIKVLALALVVRLVMIDAGVMLIHIPYVDPALLNLIATIKSYFQ